MDELPETIIVRYGLPELVVMECTSCERDVAWWPRPVSLAGLVRTARAHLGTSHERRRA